MKTLKLKFLSAILGIVLLLTAGIPRAEASKNRHYRDYKLRIDHFKMSGPGAVYPWEDDFKNGSPDDWTNHGIFGVWNYKPRSKYALLKSPGLIQPFQSMFLERSDIFTRDNFIVNVNGNFKGTATFKAELPERDQSISLTLHYIYLKNGHVYQDQVIVTISNFSPELTESFNLAELPALVGLQVSQMRLVLDWDLNIDEITDFDVWPIRHHGKLRTVILVIEYDSVGRAFKTGYSFKKQDDDQDNVSFSFSPIPSNLDLAAPLNWPPQVFWSIKTNKTYASVPVDIEPESCPNLLNTKSKGTIPVAIMGTKDFDVSEINPKSCELEGVKPKRWKIKDVGAPFPLFAGKKPPLIASTATLMDIRTWS